jgi:hypothetical protein
MFHKLRHRSRCRSFFGDGDREFRRYLIIQLNFNYRLVSRSFAVIKPLTRPKINAAAANIGIK